MGEDARYITSIYFILFQKIRVPSIPKRPKRAVIGPRMSPGSFFKNSTSILTYSNSEHTIISTQIRYAQKVSGLSSYKKPKTMMALEKKATGMQILGLTLSATYPDIGTKNVAIMIAVIAIDE